MKCLTCNNEFEPKNSLHKYCCFECKTKANVKSKIIKRTEKRNIKWENIDKKKTCLICGKEFELQRRHRTQKYCSDECRRKAESVFGNKSEIDLQYKDQIRFGGNKYKVLERDNYECQICSNQSQLVVHHKDLSGQSEQPNNDMDNLVTLCRRCHVNIHRIKI